MAETEGVQETQENNTKENGSNIQWTLGEDAEELDMFPQKNGETPPPAAPSDGRGGLTREAQQALMEKRKRLK